MEFDISDAMTWEPDHDELETLRIWDIRKPKITLSALNRLKKIRAMKALQKSQDQEILGIIYGNDPAADQSSGGIGGM